MLSVMLVCVLSLSVLLGIDAYAAKARYAYTTRVICSLTISSNKAYCRSEVEGGNNVSKIKIKQYLEKKNGTRWTTVANGTWSDSASGSSMTLSNSKSNLSSGTYRLRSVFTVYSGNSYEEFTKYSTEKTV